MNCGGSSTNYLPVVYQRLQLNWKSKNQTVRIILVKKNIKNGEVVGCHIEPGPGGGIVHLDDDQNSQHS